MPKEAAAFIQMSLDDKDAKRPVTRVFRHVLLISNFFQGVIEETAAAHGLQRGDFMVVMTLHRSDRGEGMRPTELFRSLLVTSGAITKRLDRLEQMGLLERLQGSADGRSNPVRLTRKGLKIAEKVRMTENRMHRVAARLRPGDLERLDQSLVNYLNAMYAVEAEEAKPRRATSGRRHSPRS